MNLTPEVVNPAVVDVTTSPKICGLGVSVVVGVSSDVAWRISSIDLIKNFIILRMIFHMKILEQLKTTYIWKMLAYFNEIETSMGSAYSKSKAAQREHKKRMKTIFILDNVCFYKLKTHQIFVSFFFIDFFFFRNYYSFIMSRKQYKLIITAILKF